MMLLYPENFEKDVFINFPFDDDYAPLMNAIIFTIHDIGFQPRCSRESSNAGIKRIDKIMDIISECKYSIHDISRTELDKTSGLPRFNMPFELGLDLGCARYGEDFQREKVSLILDVEDYRYQKFISDIAGQDPFGHQNNVEKLITIIRNWMRNESPKTIPGGKKIFQRYQEFQKALPDIYTKFDWDPVFIPFNDFSSAVASWIKLNHI